MNSFVNAVMNSFVNAVKNDQLYGKTFNNDITFNSSGSRVLDLFKAVGQRGANLSKEFDLALSENKFLTYRTVFWTRDIRGGAGEREVFRNFLRHMENHYVDDLKLMLPVIPVYGRWDDLLVFETMEIKKEAFKVIAKALDNKDGLCAKWMPRKGKIAAQLRTFLGLSPKRYRKTLVNLTKVVEAQMCAKQWNEIIYDHVPSVAAARYQKAFNKHDPVGYKTYRDGLSIVKSDGTTERKINTDTLYPYDVVQSWRYGNRQVAEAQWAALKDYLNEGFSILPMIDLSGSMGSWGYYGQRNQIKSKITPMDIAISIGLYTSSRQKGAFQGTWLNFSTTPKLRKFDGELTLTNMYNQLDFSDWGGSTNVDAAFSLILDTAVKNKVPASDMPNILLIVSDMEFNGSVQNANNTAYQRAANAFNKAGYELPKVVFWCVNGRADNNPVQAHSSGTALVSGFSPAVFKSILSNKIEDFSPYNIMLETISSKRYDVPGLTV